jgi:ATP-dependent DNA helicase RecG
VKGPCGVSLPFKIDYLLTSGRVESERLEFKTGWNPLKIMHTLCAFANDFHNLGGGYIVLGVASHDGRPRVAARRFAGRQP